MEAQSLVSHQHSWWFSCFSLREKLARSHNTISNGGNLVAYFYLEYYHSSLKLLKNYL